MRFRDLGPGLRVPFRVFRVLGLRVPFRVLGLIGFRA